MTTTQTIQIAFTAEDRAAIVDNILDREHVSGGTGQYLAFAVWSDGTQRAVRDRGTHFRPEPALHVSPLDLLDTESSNSYTWGEGGESEEQARDWIEQGLRSGDIEIELPDGSTRNVRVQWSE